MRKLLSGESLIPLSSEKNLSPWRRVRNLSAMHLVCLDLEGVLLPEFWIAAAEATGIDALRRTTREEPDYDVLMRYRLDVLNEHQITLPVLYEAIRDLKPLPGAVEFLAWLESQTRVIILSDTFTQFAKPLMAQLQHPTLFCHQLVTTPEGRILDYMLRIPDHKRLSVEAFRKLNFKVISAGDSYNDLTMLKASDAQILFRPPDSLVAEYPDYPVARNHRELRSLIEQQLD